MAHFELKERTASRLTGILERAHSAGLSENDFRRCLQSNKLFSTTTKNHKWRYFSLIANCVVFKFLPVVFLGVLLYFPVSEVLSHSPCLVSQIPPFGEVMHPKLDCDFCEGLRGAPHLTNLSQYEFVSKYAYTSRPVLVVGAAYGWPAMEVFSYNYFKDLYQQSPEAIDSDTERGQFFSYSSNIRNLKDLFELSSEGVSMATEKWYIGWSTADPSIGQEIQKHFSTPYFIPASFSQPQLAWIFMGAPGPGASIHIDSVGLPSWQAQLSGTKTWTLTPPPECEDVCNRFNVTVSRGDIIVIDTNRWYHETYIHPGNISITIGTEYH